jgi:hypothetical protein
MIAERRNRPMRSPWEKHDDRAKVRTFLHDAESARLLIEVLPRNDPQPYYSGRSAKRAWEDCDMFGEFGVEILVKDPKGQP